MKRNAMQKLLTSKILALLAAKDDLLKLPTAFTW